MPQVEQGTVLFLREIAIEVLHIRFSNFLLLLINGFTPELALLYERVTFVDCRESIILLMLQRLIIMLTFDDWFLFLGTRWHWRLHSGKGRSLHVRHLTCFTIL